LTVDTSQMTVQAPATLFGCSVSTVNFFLL
jgi:hypothetical protein